LLQPPEKASARGHYRRAYTPLRKKTTISITNSRRGKRRFRLANDQEKPWKVGKGEKGEGNVSNDAHVTSCKGETPV